MKNDALPSNPVRRLAADVLFGIHVLVFLFFPLGFLIPSSIWPERIVVHFWYSFVLFLLFYAWGLLWTLKFRDRVYAICVLDTVMQAARGFSMWDPRNYRHSFV